MTSQTRRSIASLAMVTAVIFACERQKPAQSEPVKPTGTPVNASAAKNAVARALETSFETLPDPTDARLPFAVGALPRREVTAGRRGRYAPTESGLAVTVRDARLEVPVTSFGPCVSNERPPPNRRVSERATTWLLDGPSGELGLRLSALDISIVAFDPSLDCVRAAAFTHRLTGHAEPLDGALLDPGPLGLDDHDARVQAEADLEVPRGNATVPPVPERGALDLSVGRDQALVSKPDGSVVRFSVGGDVDGDWRHRIVWAHRDSRDWLRFAATSERVVDTDVASGSESSVTSELTRVSPQLRFQRTATWSTPSREVEDGRERVRRRVPFEGGWLEVETHRTYFDGAKMIGAGKCPEMEGVVDIDWERTESRWTFTSDTGASVTLGDAGLTVFQTSACIEAVAPQFGRSPKLSARPVPEQLITVTSMNPESPGTSAP